MLIRHATEMLRGTKFELETQARTEARMNI